MRLITIVVGRPEEASVLFVPKTGHYSLELKNALTSQFITLRVILGLSILIASFRVVFSCKLDCATVRMYYKALWLFKKANIAILIYCCWLGSLVHFPGEASSCFIGTDLLSTF